ncbi:hypothetical protein Tco_0349859 [Tanacetum coccineum]
MDFYWQILLLSILREVRSYSKDKFQIGDTSYWSAPFRRIPRGVFEQKSVRQLGRIGSFLSLTCLPADRWSWESGEFGYIFGGLCS